MAGPTDPNEPVTIGPEPVPGDDFPQVDFGSDFAAADDAADIGFEEDRDLPPPATASNTQLAFGAAFLGLLGAAIWFLLFREPSTANDNRLTAPTETRFTPNTGGPGPTPPTARPPAPAPVPTAPVAPTPPPATVTDPARRPRYNPQDLQAERARLARLQAEEEARLARLRARIQSQQVIFDQGGSGLLGAGSASGDAAPGGLASLLGAQTGAAGGEGSPGAAPGGSAVNALGGLGEDAPRDANASFFDSVAGNGTPTVRSTRLERLDNVLPQGTVIAGVLETAINTDLPGMLRAVVSEDIYSFDGSSVLVPRGSRVTGRYSASVRPGQNRIFIIWERILRPDGVSIRVDSPGTDALGTAGLRGDVDTHFLQRFGSAILLTLIEGGLQIAAAEAADGNNATLVIGGGTADRTGDIADRALERNIDIPPTIHVDQGTRINIFVSQDLLFD